MKKIPFVFQSYKPLFYPSRGKELISGAPISEYEQGHIYFMTEKETEGCPGGGRPTATI